MIDTDTIDGWLDGLLTRSKPGDSMHMLLVAVGETGCRNALGRIDPEALHVTLYCINSYADDDINDVMSVVIEALHPSEAIYFAGLAIEAYSAPRQKRSRGPGTRVSPEEATFVYAASADGRRWTGHRVLTGPRTGTVVGPLLRAGALAVDEHTDMCRRVRAMVRGAR